MKKYCQNETKFNGAYSKDKLHKIKDGAYVVNLDEYESVETHWIVSYVNGNKVTYFDSFGAEYIAEEIKKTHRRKKYYIYRTIQLNNVPVILYWIYWFYIKR